ncbi:MAG: DUF1298 domain-containing protein [Dermatophilaceae bacterium]|jgi:diacylglycerol O-acyltransferase|nr:DUF1298 domain-containing protein [Dermatophilaceae bacterium]MBP9917041.1 DUF1298 domain-containing protein [Dermatophilaceae bacterium]
MQRLTGLDEMYLALDTPKTTGHVAGIAVFEASPPPPGGRLAWLRTRVAERLPMLPLLRWSLHSVPLGLDARHWVEAPDLNLEEHIVATSLPTPGSRQQLLDFVDGIMAEHLPRDRPMWRIHLIEGLENGGFALLVKITHGLTDGSALWAIYDALSDEPSDAPRTESAPLSPLRRRVALARRALTQTIARPLEVAKLQADLAAWASGQVAKEGMAALPHTLMRVLPGELSRPFGGLLAKVGEEHQRDIEPLMPTMRPPASPFNGTVTTNLGVALTDFAVADLRAVGKKVGGTVNDAVLAITAGALRAYMADHGGVSDQPLIGSAPISWRTGQETERWANHVWMLFLPIPTHLTDPTARVRFAHEAATRAKTTWDNIPSHLVRRAAALIPSAIMAPGARIMTALPAGVVPRLYNVAISNVRGPQQSPVYAGAPIAEYFIYGFLSPGCGLLVAGQSLGDRMILSATACKDIVPDYATFPSYMEASMKEHLAAPAEEPKTTKAS